MNEQPPPNPEIVSRLQNDKILRQVFEVISADRKLRSGGDVTRVKISYINVLINVNEAIRDALHRDEGLHALRFEGGNAILLLIDPEPYANWAHQCWLATYDVDYQRARVVLHSFPPEEYANHRLVTFIASYDLTRAA